MSDDDDIDNADGENTGRESEEYWSFLLDYNLRDRPYRPLLWEYGDKDGTLQCTENPTFGYWDDYYNDLEASFIDSCLIYEVRILGDRISFQEIIEAEKEIQKNINIIATNRSEINRGTPIIKDKAFDTIFEDLFAELFKDFFKTWNP